MLLFSCQKIVVLCSEIRAGVVRSAHEAVHFVLVQIYKAGVALVILVINIVDTAFAVGRLHIITFFQCVLKIPEHILTYMLSA